MVDLPEVIRTLYEGIECIGIRYGGADEDVKQFNPLIAEIEWKAFPEILSDKQALMILKNYNFLKTK